MITDTPTTFRTDAGAAYVIRPVTDAEVEHFAAAAAQGFGNEVPTHIATGGAVGDLAIIVTVTGGTDRRVPGGFGPGRRGTFRMVTPESDTVRGWVVR